MRNWAITTTRADVATLLSGATAALTANTAVLLPVERQGTVVDASSFAVVAGRAFIVGVELCHHGCAAPSTSTLGPLATRHVVKVEVVYSCLDMS